MINNFYDELNACLEHLNKNLNDIEYVGSEGCYIPLERLKEAFDFEYNSGWGSNEIPLDLVVVFKDKSWLERHEYDGSEWWEYKQTPIVSCNVEFPQGKTVKIKNYESSLAEIIDPEIEWGY